MPACDQTLILNKTHMPILFTIFDKTLTYAQTTHGVICDVLEIVESYSSIFLSNDAFELYFQKLLDLMNQYSSLPNQLALICRNISVTIYVHQFIVRQRHLDKLLENIYQLLLSNQTQVRLIIADVLYAIIDIFHPIDIVTSKIESFRKDALKENATETQQHAYILSTASLIASYKTEIPQFLVKILVDFASITFTSNLCATTKKNTLLDFWDCHKDMWDVYYAPLFTSEERSLLKEGNTPEYIV